MKNQLGFVPKKILIVKPSAFGDIVHSLPFLAAVKKSYPAASIHWVVARGLHSFLEGHPQIDKLWVIDKERWKKLNNLGQTLADIARLYRGLGREGYDVAIDLSGILRSGLITYASKAGVKIGFEESDEGSPFFYTHKIHGDMSIHAIDRYLKIAAFMGCDISEIEYPFAPYDPNPAVCEALPDDYAVMAPSAGKEANRWPARHFGELAARLPIKTVIISSAADSQQADEVVKASEGKAISLAGKTSLKELLAVIQKSRFFVSNDTGPMHVAAALNVPVFAIFGPANPNRTGPHGSIHTVIQEELDCIPCYAWKPCDHWQCMKKITVDKVESVIRKRGVLRT